MRGLILAAVFAATGSSVLGQERRNIMYERPVPGGPTYGQLAERFFAQFVFPPELGYKGVGLHRDNVIAERMETNGRGGYWLSVRARYSGRVGFIPVPVAERARVHYDNGGVRVDLGGLHGVVNTRAIGAWIVRSIAPMVDRRTGRVGAGGAYEMICPGLPLALVVNGKRIQWATSAGSAFATMSRRVTAQQYHAVPLLAEVLSGAPVVGAPGRPAAFVTRDGKLIRVDDVRPILANHSRIRMIPVQDYDRYQAIAELHVVR